MDLENHQQHLSLYFQAHSTDERIHRHLRLQERKQNQAQKWQNMLEQALQRLKYLENERLCDTMVRKAIDRKAAELCTARETDTANCIKIDGFSSSMIAVYMMSNVEKEINEMISRRWKSGGTVVEDLDLLLKNLIQHHNYRHYATQNVRRCQQKTACSIETIVDATTADLHAQASAIELQNNELHAVKAQRIVIESECENILANLSTALLQCKRSRENVKKKASTVHLMRNQFCNRLQKTDDLLCNLYRIQVEESLALSLPISLPRCIRDESDATQCLLKLQFPIHKDAAIQFGRNLYDAFVTTTSHSTVDMPQLEVAFEEFYQSLKCELAACRQNEINVLNPQLLNAVISARTIIHNKCPEMLIAEKQLWDTRSQAQMITTDNTVAGMTWPHFVARCKLAETQKD